MYRFEISLYGSEEGSPEFPSPRLESDSIAYELPVMKAITGASTRNGTAEKSLYSSGLS